jgi:uncharacterized phage-associated protein
MTASAHDVATALRERLPGLPTVKLHKLLYYCQGHHLAAFGEKLFHERISAWDMGPVVGELWRAEQHGEAPQAGTGMAEAQLNTIGYVVSRYGELTGRELEILTHGESPWQRADADRPAGRSARIDPVWIREHFVAAEMVDRAEEPALDPVEVAALLSGAEQRRAGPRYPDDLDVLRSRIAELASAHG